MKHLMQVGSLCVPILWVLGSSRGHLNTYYMCQHTCTFIPLFIVIPYPQTQAELVEKLRQIEAEYELKKRPLYKARGEVISRIPGFWLHCFMQHERVSHILGVVDQDILSHLQEVRCSLRFLGLLICTFQLWRYCRDSCKAVSVLHCVIYGQCHKHLHVRIPNSRSAQVQQWRAIYGSAWFWIDLYSLVAACYSKVVCWFQLIRNFYTHFKNLYVGVEAYAL